MIEQSETSGFIAIYRWQVEADHEQLFRERWRDLTLRARELGAYGSCLTRNRKGEFVAIALWPSEEARAETFGKMDAGTALPGVRRLDDDALQVEDDLWLTSPFSTPRT